MSEDVTTGWFRLGDPPQAPSAGVPEQATVIVVGVERGGTSLVAAALHHLGVHMGEGLGATFEDPEVLNLFLRHPEGPPRAAFAELVAQRDSARAFWGWKVPSVVPEGLLDLVRQPRLVTVYRDSVAAAGRLAAAQHLAPADGLRYLEQVRTEITRFALAAQVPCLFVSYEKALAAPEAFCRELAAFVGLDPPAGRRVQAAAAIRPSPPEYLRETAHAPVRGAVDAIGDTVDGWVADLRTPNHPLSGALVFDGGALRVPFTADAYRADLARQGIGDGYHAFFVDLPTCLRDGLEHTVGVEIDAADPHAAPVIDGTPAHFRTRAA